MSHAPGFKVLLFNLYVEVFRMPDDSSVTVDLQGTFRDCSACLCSRCIHWDPCYACAYGLSHCEDGVLHCMGVARCMDHKPSPGS